MVQVRCPKCSSLVDGIEGQEAVCGQCGYRALLPVAPAASLAPKPGTSPPTPSPAAPRPPGHGSSDDPSVRATPPMPAGGVMLALWGYILGIAAIATFFLASVGLPFAFGVAALVLGLMGWQRDKNDRRAMLGMVLGALGILLAVVWIYV